MLNKLLEPNIKAGIGLATRNIGCKSRKKIFRHNNNE